jgi:hypothetical protein
VNIYITSYISYFNVLPETQMLLLHARNYHCIILIYLTQFPKTEGRHRTLHSLFIPTMAQQCDPLMYFRAAKKHEVTYIQFLHGRGPRAEVLNCCVISGFRHHVDDICALLRYYITKSGNCVPTFRGNLSVPLSRVKNSQPLLGLLYP